MSTIDYDIHLVGDMILSVTCASLRPFCSKKCDVIGKMTSQLWK
jgi:hypothetical protein